MPALNPEIASIVERERRADVHVGGLNITDVAGARDALRSLRRPTPSTAAGVFRDVQTSSEDGHLVTLRVHLPKDRRDRAAGGDVPAILWLHGGGYVSGSALDPNPRAERWSSELGSVVVSVEYRLAPEHPFPAALLDCHAGFVWLVEHAAELGVDHQRIAVAGASAGAGLAAAVTLWARDRGAALPGFQLLLYAMLDDRQLTPSSRDPDAIVWNGRLNDLCWRAYLGCDPGANEVTPYAAPSRAVDLSGLPPAFIGVGALDVFRDENVAYAQRLAACGVPVELHMYPGAPHGFVSLFPSVPISQQFQADIDRALRRALGPLPPSSVR